MAKLEIVTETKGGVFTVRHERARPFLILTVVRQPIGMSSQCHGLAAYLSVAR